MFWSGQAEQGRRHGRLRQALGKWGLAVALASGLSLGVPAVARSPEAAVAGKPEIALASLPEPAQQTYRRILSGGPFRYQKDGTVFGNRERLLPAQPRGYYREYTVRTPGSRDRGARRIVCGGPPRQPDDCYYTADHYASFRRIVE